MDNMLNGDGNTSEPYPEVNLKVHLGPRVGFGGLMINN
jgi:hypothetical protein